MKIFIPNILPSYLKDKLTTLENKISIPNHKKFYELVSEEFGLLLLDETNIKRIEPSFNTNIELIKGYFGRDLLVDLTKYTEVSMISQLPTNYICTKITQLEYKFDKKSELKLVVKCIEENVDLGKSFIPIDFYFLYDEAKIINLQDLLNNIFFQEEINRFLSALN
jgi:hypothetical protein